LRKTNPLLWWIGIISDLEKLDASKTWFSGDPTTTITESTPINLSELQAAARKLNVWPEKTENIIKIQSDKKENPSVVLTPEQKSEWKQYAIQVVGYAHLRTILSCLIHIGENDAVNEFIGRAKDPEKNTPLADKFFKQVFDKEVEEMQKPPKSVDEVKKRYEGDTFLALLAEYSTRYPNLSFQRLDQTQKESLLKIYRRSVEKYQQKTQLSEVVDKINAIEAKK